tara:strand:+ start:160 stop:381 length:222 start_codon:yes stop_codon:yes gene_type:complete
MVLTPRDEADVELGQFEKRPSNEIFNLTETQWCSLPMELTAQLAAKLGDIDSLIEGHLVGDTKEEHRHNLTAY